MPAGDIALAFRQYWGATLDTAWLRTSGWPVIHGVARYYASRAQLSPDDGLYHIANTTGPDEQNVNVVDSAFGNCIAKMTLLAAHDLAASAGAAPNSTFKHIADKMFIPYDSELDYHPEYLHWNGTKHTFMHQFYTKKTNVYQDRLGTNIRKVVKQEALHAESAVGHGISLTKQADVVLMQYLLRRILV